MANERTSAILQYSNLVVRVRSADPSHVEWLTEFLSPQFRARDDAKPHCVIELICDTRRYHRLLNQSRRAHRHQVSCFALDRGLVALPVWSRDDDVDVLHDRASEAFYIVAGDRRTVCIVTRGKDLAARVAFMKVVREFAMNHVQRRGCLIVHGSSFVVRGRGVIIAGPKRSGKTSLLVHALRSRNTCYLSNDRVVVFMDRAAPRLRGMPTIVAIRRQTLGMFPQIDASIRTSMYHPALTTREVRSGRTTLDGQGWNGRFSFSPAQFCELAGTRSVPSARAYVVVFPQIDARSRSIELEELDPSRAVKRLRMSLFRAGARYQTSAVFDLQTPSLARTDQRDQCRELVSRLRCFQCRLGPDAYRTPESVSRFVSALAGA